MAVEHAGHAMDVRWVPSVNSGAFTTTKVLDQPLTSVFRTSAKWKWVGKDETDEAYATTLARFLCGCIQTLDRGKDRFCFPLLEDLQVKARAFLVALQSIPPDT